MDTRTGPVVVGLIVRDGRVVAAAPYLRRFAIGRPIDWVREPHERSGWAFAWLGP
jgi:hypothetical protein